MFPFQKAHTIYDSRLHGGCYFVFDLICMQHYNLSVSITVTVQRKVNLKITIYTIFMPPSDGGREISVKNSYTRHFHYYFAAGQGGGNGIFMVNSHACFAQGELPVCPAAATEDLL